MVLDAGQSSVCGWGTHLLGVAAVPRPQGAGLPWSHGDFFWAVRAHLGGGGAFWRLRAGAVGGLPRPVLACSRVSLGAVPGHVSCKVPLPWASLEPRGGAEPGALSHTASFTPPPPPHGEASQFFQTTFAVLLFIFGQQQQFSIPTSDMARVTCHSRKVSDSFKVPSLFT